MTLTGARIYFGRQASCKGGPLVFGHGQLPVNWCGCNEALRGLDDRPFFWLAIDALSREPASLPLLATGVPSDCSLPSARFKLTGATQQLPPSADGPNLPEGSKGRAASRRWSEVGRSKWKCWTSPGNKRLPLASNQLNGGPIKSRKVNLFSIQC